MHTGWPQHSSIRPVLYKAVTPPALPFSNHTHRSDQPLLTHFTPTLRVRDTQGNRPMSSQRPGRHQRRASQSVFVLPENLATLDVDAAAEAGGKAGLDGAGAEQQARPPAGRHRRAMSVAVAARDLELIKEDLGSYKVGA